MDVVIDSEETVGKDLEEVDPSVLAVLVRKGGGAGAVRVTGGNFKNVVTGPTRGTGFAIVVVASGENCRLFGNTSVRYFHRRNP